MLAKNAALSGLRAAAVQGLPWIAWKSGLAGEAQGFSFPGNTGISEEMKEVGRPDEVRRNEEATQRHLYSEKARFDQSRYENPEVAESPFGKAFAEGGDTAPECAVTEASPHAAPGQSMGINIIPEKLAAAKADEELPEALLHTAGATPWEVTPDNRAGEMGPGMGATYAAWDAQTRGERPPPSPALPPEAAGAEGEPVEIIEEMHMGDEWST